LKRRVPQVSKVLYFSFGSAYSAPGDTAMKETDMTLGDPPPVYNSFG
jgi:hypothetical protein